MIPAKITPNHLKRTAYVYIRQSSLSQVRDNLESRRRQYELADRARSLGWSQVEVVDEDLGRSGSGRVVRPGFQRLLSAVCLEEVGGVFALEASRLARNNRDWYHLVDLCGLTSTLIIDAEGVYDPHHFNDRLLLGLKGTMSEWELAVMRQRSLVALREKAERGELHTTLAIGFLRTRDDRCELDPDRRIRTSIGLVFEKFEELGSIRQVLLWFRQEGVELPGVEYGPFGRGVVWRLAVYSSVHHILTNPVYAGAYAYGRTRTETTIVDGQPRRRQGIPVAQDEWAVLIPEHHEGYIGWEQYQANQRRIAENAQMKGLMSRGLPDEADRSLRGCFGAGAADAGSMSPTAAPTGGSPATAAVARRSITGPAPASRSAGSPRTEPWRKPCSPSSNRAPWRLRLEPRSTPGRTGSRNMTCSRSNSSRPATRRSGRVGNSTLSSRRTALWPPSSSGAGTEL